MQTGVGIQTSGIDLVTRPEHAILYQLEGIELRQSPFSLYPQPGELRCCGDYSEYLSVKPGANLDLSAQ